MDKFVVSDPAKAALIAGWLTSGRQVRRWVSADLSCMRPDILTPNEHSPHWAYPKAVTITVDDIVFERQTTIDVPAEWMPKPLAAHATTGKLSVATRRKIEGLLVRLRERHAPMDVQWDVDGDLVRFYQVTVVPFSEYMEKLNPMQT